MSYPNVFWFVFLPSTSVFTAFQRAAALPDVCTIRMPHSGGYNCCWKLSIAPKIWNSHPALLYTYTYCVLYIYIYIWIKRVCMMIRYSSSWKSMNIYIYMSYIVSIYPSGQFGQHLSPGTPRRVPKMLHWVVRSFSEVDAGPLVAKWAEPFLKWDMTGTDLEI